MNIILEEYKRDVKTNDIYRALEDGIYDAKINDVEIKISKNGNRMMCVKIELLGEKMLNGAHLGGRRETYFVMLNDKYAGVKMHSLLTGCGVDVRVGDEINVEQLIVSNVLMNKLVKAKLIKSSYVNKEGKEVECNRVRYLVKADKQQQEDVSHVMREISDDDIPF